MKISKSIDNNKNNKKINNIKVIKNDEDMIDNSQLIDNDNIEILNDKKIKEYNDNEIDLNIVFTMKSYSKNTIFYKCKKKTKMFWKG